MARQRVPSQGLEQPAQSLKPKITKLNLAVHALDRACSSIDSSRHVIPRFITCTSIMGPESTGSESIGVQLFTSQVITIDIR